MNSPMAQVYANVLFSKQDYCHSDDFGLRNPVNTENIVAELGYLYRRTRHIPSISRIRTFVPV